MSNRLAVLVLTGRLTLIVIMATCASLVMSPGQVYAETPVSVPCADGTTGTAIRSSKAFTNADYEAACKGHGGPADTDTTYTDDGSDADANNTVSSGATSTAGGDGKDCASLFFGIPAWYRGMQDDSCAFKAPETNGQADAKLLVLMIALNIVQAGMVVVAYVTVFFLIKGGFGYITSAGSSEGMASAKKTITNAIVGLIIAILAASIVNAIAGAIS